MVVVAGLDLVVMVVAFAVGLSVVGIDVIVSSAPVDVLGAFCVVVRFVGGTIGAALVNLPVDHPGPVGDTGRPPLVMASAVETAGGVGEGWGDGA